MLRVIVTALSGVLLVAWTVSRGIGDPSRAPIRLELRGQGIHVAAGECRIEADGRVQFTACTVRVSRDSGDGLTPEETVLRSSRARCRVEPAVTTVADLGRCTITEIESAGGVRLTFPERLAADREDVVPVR